MLVKPKTNDCPKPSATKEDSSTNKTITKSEGSSVATGGLSMLAAYSDSSEESE